MVKKILIVEDESITSFELEMKAQRWGYSVVGIAISGEEAFKMAIELKPDLIIMDIMINGMEDGVELIERIQSEIEVPFIYLTAYSSNTIMNRAHKTSPYAYILKPFDDKELKFAIELAFYKHDLEKELKKADKQYNDLMDNLMTGIFIADIKGDILSINKFLADILSNCSLDDTLDRRIELQNQLKTKTFLEKLKKNGKINNQTFTIVKKDENIKMNLNAKLENNRIYGIIN